MGEFPIALQETYIRRKKGLECSAAQERGKGKTYTNKHEANLSGSVMDTITKSVTAAFQHDDPFTLKHKFIGTTSEIECNI